MRSKRANRRKQAVEKVISDSSQIPINELRHLNQHHIYFRSTKFKRPFICQVCNTWLPSLSASLHHSRQVVHNDNLLIEGVKSVLYYLPPITEAHRSKLTATLEEFTTRIQVTPFELNRRKQFANSIMSVLRDRFSDLEVIGMGSTWHGVVLYESDVNMNICCMKQLPLSDAKERYPSDKSCSETSRAGNGLGYLLSDVYDFLESAAKDHDPPPQPRCCELLEREKSGDFSEPASPLDVIHSVKIGDPEFFNIAFKDDRWVTYRITTDHPYGSFHTSLISTYLSLNHQVVQLVILFRHFFKFAYLDLPWNGTFIASVVPVMVIFYAQHCRPRPLLPNLHTLYRDNRDAVPQEAVTEVFINKQDLSFIHDKQVILDLLAASKGNEILIPAQGDATSADALSGGTESSEVGDLVDAHVENGSKEQVTNDTPSLADLWLGLLRFYLFDFMKNRFQVNIIDNNPVPVKHVSRNALFINDPFRPGRSMCSNVITGCFEFIWAQMLAAYGYFGVPRLARNGRHLFTKVKIDDGSDRSKSSVAGTSCAGQSASCSTPGQGGGPALPGEILVHLCPVIDDTQNYDDNFVKVYSRLAEVFTVQIQALQRSACLSSEKALHRPPTTDTINTVALCTVLPNMLKFILDEVLDSQEVPSVVKKSIAQKKTCPTHFLDTQLTIHQLNKLMRNLATSLWNALLTNFIRVGKLTIPESWLVKRVVGSCRRVISYFVPEMDCNHNGIKIEPPMELTGNTMAWPESHTQLIGGDEQNVITAQGASDDDPDDGATDQDEDDENLEDIDLFDVTAEESYLGVNCSFQSTDETNHKDSLPESGPMYDESDDSAVEFTEQPVDLKHDVYEDEDDGVMQVMVTDEPECERGGADSLTFEAMDCVPGDLTAPEGGASNIQDDAPVLLSGDAEGQTLVGSTPVKKSCSSIASATSKRPSEAVETTSPSDVAPTQSLESESGRATHTNGVRVSKKWKQGAKQQTLARTPDGGPARWDVVILTREALGPPVDDLRMGYYNSASVNALKPEDMDFPFTPGGSFPPKGDGLVSYVLGIGDSGLSQEKSSMIAHLKPPKPQCNACGQLGHRIGTCEVTSDKSVSFVAWRNMAESAPQPPSEEHLVALSDCLLELTKLHDPTKMHQERSFIQTFLLNIFSRTFSGVNLEVFGSCANGFELPSSDMDICVFFPTQSRECCELQKIKTAIPLIRSFGRLLCGQRYVYFIERIRSILSAKVPILKVRFRTGFEADISFSNYLAIINTRMLKMYAVIEPRLRTLGVALKVIVKLHHIGDASHGGISSYAYVLMLIHYMQQKNQLPVLQEMYEGPVKPENIVCGWNAWYQDDISVVGRLWKPPQQRPHIADLWLGFFRYYLFEFNRDLHVVTIRQKATLTRFVKMWASLFAIEDPFDLDHNLTRVLKRDMLLYILDVFNAILVHQTTFLPGTIPTATWRYRLFDPSQLDKHRCRGPPKPLHCTYCFMMGCKSCECPSPKRAAKNKVRVRGADTGKSLISGLLAQNGVASDQAITLFPQQMRAPAPPRCSTQFACTSHRVWTPQAVVPWCNHILPVAFAAPTATPTNPPQMQHHGVYPSVPQMAAYRQPGGMPQAPYHVPRWPNRCRKESVARATGQIQQPQWSQNRQNYEERFPFARQSATPGGNSNQGYGRGCNQCQQPANAQCVSGQQQRLPQPPGMKSKGSSPGITHQRQPAVVPHHTDNNVQQYRAHSDGFPSSNGRGGRAGFHGRNRVVSHTSQISALSGQPRDGQQRGFTLTGNRQQISREVPYRRGCAERGIHEQRRPRHPGAVINRCSSAQGAFSETDHLVTRLHRLPGPST